MLVCAQHGNIRALFTWLSPVRDVTISLLGSRWAGYWSTVGGVFGETSPQQNLGNYFLARRRRVLVHTDCLAKWVFGP